MKNKKVQKIAIGYGCVSTVLGFSNPFVGWFVLIRIIILFSINLGRWRNPRYDYSRAIGLWHMLRQLFNLMAHASTNVVLQTFLGLFSRNSFYLLGVGWALLSFYSIQYAHVYPYLRNTWGIGSLDKKGWPWLLDMRRCLVIWPNYIGRGVLMGNGTLLSGDPGKNRLRVKWDCWLDPILQRQLLIESVGINNTALYEWFHSNFAKISDNTVVIC